MRLPHFVVIGAAKSGTTSLYHYLRQHPDIFMPPRKEPSFFAHEGRTLDFKGPGDDEWNFVTELSEYERLFAQAPPNALLGDISPRYLYFEQSSARIAHHIPCARIVAILRHPVDRAYSHFLMNRRRGCEPEADFERALEREPERARIGWGWDWQYTGAGLYFQQLQRYYQRFDHGQIKVFPYEDLARDPYELFRRLFRFLGVNESVRLDTTARHRSAFAPQSYTVQELLRRIDGIAPLIRQHLPNGFARKSAGNLVKKVQAWNHAEPAPLSPATREALFDRYFADDCARLEILTGNDLSMWREAGLPRYASVGMG